MGGLIEGSSAVARLNRQYFDRLAWMNMVKPIARMSSLEKRRE